MGSCKSATRPRLLFLHGSSGRCQRGTQGARRVIRRRHVVQQCVSPEGTRHSGSRSSRWRWSAWSVIRRRTGRPAWGGVRARPVVVNACTSCLMSHEFVRIVMVQVRRGGLGALPPRRPSHSPTLFSIYISLARRDRRVLPH